MKCAKEKKGLWIRRGCYGETNREYLLLPRVQVQIDMLHEQNGESFYGLLWIMRFYQSKYAKAQDIQGGVASVLHVQRGGSRKRVMQDVYVKEKETREWNNEGGGINRTYRKSEMKMRSLGDTLIAKTCARYLQCAATSDPGCDSGDVLLTRATMA